MRIRWTPADAIKMIWNESLASKILHVSSKRFDQMVAELTVRLQMTARDDIVQTEFGSTKWRNQKRTIWKEQMEFNFESNTQIRRTSD